MVVTLHVSVENLQAWKQGADYKHEIYRQHPSHALEDTDKYNIITCAVTGTTRNCSCDSPDPLQTEIMTHYMM